MRQLLYIKIKLVYAYIVDFFLFGVTCSTTSVTSAMFKDLSVYGQVLKSIFDVLIVIVIFLTVLIRLRNQIKYSRKLEEDGK